MAQFQDVELDFPIRVIDVVLMSKLNQSLTYSKSENDEKQALEVLGNLGISHLATRTLDALSGGEKQRVFLARVLMNDPQLLILDEPMTSVDIHAEQEFYDLLVELNKKMAIIMISHDISAVSRFVKKIACLNKTMIYHDSKEITEMDLAKTYNCDVDLIAHGIPHRVLKCHHD